MLYTYIHKSLSYILYIIHSEHNNKIPKNKLEKSHYYHI